MSSIETDIKRKNILYEWLTPAVEKSALEVEQAKEKLDSKSFSDYDAMQKSNEKKTYDTALEFYETLETVRQSMRDRLNVYGYIGPNFMEVVYQAVLSVNRLPPHYFREGKNEKGNPFSLVGYELTEGRKELLDFYRSYVQTEGNQYLSGKPFNVPKGQDATTYTYEMAFTSLSETDIDLEAYKPYQNPVKWWAQQPTKKRYMYGSVSILSILISISVYFQWKLKNAKK